MWAVSVALSARIWDEMWRKMDRVFSKQWKGVTNGFHVAIYLFGNRSQTTSKVRTKGWHMSCLVSNVTNVLTTFWRLLWSVTEETHGDMESICFICLQISGNSKVMQFVYWRLDNCPETAYWSLLLWMARMEMECLLKNLTSVFQSLYPSF